MEWFGIFIFGILGMWCEGSKLQKTASDFGSRGQRGAELNQGELSPFSEVQPKTQSLWICMVVPQATHPN
jgi:hypothetical protein